MVAQDEINRINPPQQVDTGIGIGAIADNVAKTHKTIDPSPGSVFEKGLERLKIGMHIRKNGDSHVISSFLLTPAPLPSPSIAVSRRQSVCSPPKEILLCKI